MSSNVLYKRSKYNKFTRKGPNVLNEMSNDQESQSPLAKRMKTYVVVPANDREWCYLDSKSADVYFTFGSDNNPTSTEIARVGAHKILLARESDVFKTMFYGEMKERGAIRLTDVTEEEFKVFLRFFYFNEVQPNIENIAAVLYLGHKYNHANCIDICVQFLKDSHTVDNTLFVLALAIRFDHMELVKICKRSIVRNTVAVINSKGFLDCDRTLLAYIFDDSWFVCTEVELFEACMVWVKAKSGHDVLTKDAVDEHLGELFYEIRFDSMTIEQFCELAEKNAAVLSNDFQTITKLIGLPDFQQDIFNIRPRQIKWNDGDEDNFGKILICDRKEPDSLKSSFIAKDEGELIKFTASKSLLLTQFTFSEAGGIRKYPVQLQITEINGTSCERKTLLRMNAIIEAENCVLLPRPILVMPGRCYWISIKFAISYCITSGKLKTMVQLESDAVIRFFNDQINSSGAIVGIISKLEFLQI